MSEAILQLKREFVRYVSHEIRSPLNVVHAGLELLRADLAAAGALSSTLNQLQDIYIASSAAIDILNDMLQYEHIDSGTFKLDCAIVSMVRAFAGRMDGFKFLLASKNIALKIEDQAQVSEFYSPNEDGREIEVPLALSLRSSDQSVYFPSSSLVLLMDRFRVEQIIRNLMTNAVKFTPEGGNITIRFLIFPDDLQQRQQQHLDALSPETVTGFSAETLSVTKRFLRIEVQDSGVGESTMSIYILYILPNLSVRRVLQALQLRTNRRCSSSSHNSIATLFKAAVAPDWGCGYARISRPSTAAEW